MSMTPEADLTEADLASDVVLAPDSDAGQAAEAAACPNCGSLRAGSYCSKCGQKAMPLNPTVSR